MARGVHLQGADANELPPFVVLKPRTSLAVSKGSSPEIAVTCPFPHLLPEHQSWIVCCFHQGEGEEEGEGEELIKSAHVHANSREPKLI